MSKYQKEIELLKLEEKRHGRIYNFVQSQIGSGAGGYMFWDWKFWDFLKK